MSELLWKIFYVILSYFITVILLFLFSEYLFIYFFKNILKYIIVHDPQEYIYICINISLIIGFILLLLNIIAYIFFFVIELFVLEEYYYYKFLIINIVYIYFIIQWLFLEDFLFFHWEIFLTNKKILFDFQPELLTLYDYYISEYINLFLYLNLFIILIIFLYSKYITTNVILCVNFRILIIFIIFSLNIYFFSGETAFRDWILILVSFILSEIYIFSNIFFQQLQKYKK